MKETPKYQKNIVNNKREVVLMKANTTFANFDHFILQSAGNYDDIGQTNKQNIAYHPFGVAGYLKAIYDT